MPVKIPPLKPSRPYPRLEVLNPGKGLNNLISDQLIADQEASDLNNIQYVESGAPSKTTGKVAFGSGLTNNPKGLGTFYTDSGSRYVVTIDGTALKSNTSGGGTWATVSGATFTTNQETNYTTARLSTRKTAIFIWNGTDGGAYWDGTTLSRPGTMPAASYSITWNGLHCASGTGTQTSRLYLADPIAGEKFTSTTWTSPGSPPSTSPDNPTDVPGSTAASAATAGPKFYDVNPGDGDHITGLAKFKDVLVIFKERSIYQFTLDGSGNGVITPIITYLGAVSHRSIDNVENDVFYLSRLGYYVLGYEPNFFTIIRTNELSARIHPLIDTINPTNLSKVVSLYKPYRFFSSYPSGGSTSNNRTLTYDRRYQAWSNLDIYHANAFTVFIDGTNTEHLYFAADDEAQVYEIPSASYSNNGSAYTAYWVSKSFDAKIPENYKRWIDLTLIFRQISGTISITVYADNNVVTGQSAISTGTTANINNGWGTQEWGFETWGGIVDPNATSIDSTATVNVPYRMRLNATSRTIKVRVENDNNNETFTLLGLVFTYRLYSHFKFPSSLKLPITSVTVQGTPGVITDENDQPIYV